MALGSKFQIDSSRFLNAVSVPTQARRSKAVPAGFTGAQDTAFQVSKFWALVFPPVRNWYETKIWHTLGCDSEWIVQRTGIHSRYHVAEGEATSDMSIRAAQQCLQAAGVDPVGSRSDNFGDGHSRPYYSVDRMSGSSRFGLPGLGGRHQRGLFRIYLRVGDGQSVRQNRLQSQGACHRSRDALEPDESAGQESLIRCSVTEQVPC